MNQYNSGMRNASILAKRIRTFKGNRFLNELQGLYLDDKAFKIWKAKVVDEANDYEPGCIVKASKNELIVQTGDGQLALLEVQLAGKKRMDAGAFMRGYTVEEGTFFRQ